jgi:hypothetical protein
MCECYQVGGRFIAEDPECPVHGVEGQERQREQEDMERELSAWRARFPEYVYRPQDDCVALRVEQPTKR